MTSVAEDSGLRLIPIASLLSNDAKGPLTITAVSNAVGGTVAIKGSNIEFTPTADFNGTASFDYTVSKNGQADTASVSFAVTEVNDAPVATDDALTSVAEDSGKRIISFDSLLGNNSAGPADKSGQTLTITAVSNAVGGTVAINGSNVEFTPTADYAVPRCFGCAGQHALSARWRGVRHARSIYSSMNTSILQTSICAGGGKARHREGPAFRARSLSSCVARQSSAHGHAHGPRHRLHARRRF